jgi:hypothetical protein
MNKDLGFPQQDIRGLDLSTSLLPSWDVLAMIATELTHLERLSLKSVTSFSLQVHVLSFPRSRNRFSPSKDVRLMSSAFPKVKELQLNGTMMTFREVQEVTAYMPNLHSIEIGYNRLAVLSTLEASVPVQSRLYSMNLDGNECNDWRHVCLALKQYTV